MKFTEVLNGSIEIFYMGHYIKIEQVNGLFVITGKVGSEVSGMNDVYATSKSIDAAIKQARKFINNYYR